LALQAGKTCQGPCRNRPGGVCNMAGFCAWAGYAAALAPLESGRNQLPMICGGILEDRGWLGKPPPGGCPTG